MLLPLALVFLSQAPSAAAFAGAWESPKTVVLITTEDSTRVQYYSDALMRREEGELHDGELHAGSLTFKLGKDGKTVEVEGETLKRAANADAAQKRAMKASAAWTEVKAGLKNLYRASSAERAEKDEWGTTLPEKIIPPVPCLADKPGKAPKGFTAVCFFAFKLEVVGKGPTGKMIGHAVGIAAPYAGKQWSICSEGSEQGQVVPEAKVCQ